MIQKSTRKSGDKNYKLVRKPNFARIIIIVMICLVLGFFGKMVNFFGRFTGEVAFDGTRFASVTEACVNKALEKKLENGDAVFIPNVEKLEFTSESRFQMLHIGNPIENGNVLCSYVLAVGDKNFYQSGLLRPGESIGEADLLAYFNPGDEYSATITYTFYEQSKTIIDDIGSIKMKIPLTVIGSPEYFNNKSENPNDKIKSN